MSDIFAEDISYFMTSKSSADDWLDKCQRTITDAGGNVLDVGYGTREGKSAFMISFSIDEETYRVIWPVLPVKVKTHERAARIQAATLMYHDIKNRCLTALILGSKTAFFSYLMLEDGRQAVDVLFSTPLLSDYVSREE